jgi:DNA-binding transcriptional ArsR family regulator
VGSRQVIDVDACAVQAVDPEKVAAASERSIPAEEVVRVAELFKLLGDPTRVRLLYALVEAGELCVCDLSAVVGAPETSVSHALRLLRTAGVVRVRRSGRMAYYSLSDAHVRLLLDVSGEHLRYTGL